MLTRPIAQVASYQERPNGMGQESRQAPLSQEPADDAGEPGSDAPPTAAAVAAAVYRTELAGYRHRAGRAEQLRLEKGDLWALEHLAASSGLTATDLGQRLGLSSGGVTMLVDRLERAGHVERQPHPRDRRKRVLSITPDARRWLDDFLQPIVAPLERSAAWLSAADREVVFRFLDHLAALREVEALRTPRYSPPSESVPAPPVW
ncbi:MAG: MarR family winged helix-turn-helix transcriptional regulator, partial [Thermoleophilaceae bacterium]